MSFPKVKNKAQARQLAINWQSWASSEVLYLSELLRAQEFFQALGKKFGLLREYRENGII